MGNSITEGAKLSKTYPQELQDLLGEGYQVRNFGLSGRTLMKKGNKPYWNEPTYQEVLEWQPDVVIIKLGTNDSKPENWVYKKNFVKDYKKLVKSFKKLQSDPQIYLALPLPVFDDKWGIRAQIVEHEIVPAVRKVAQKTRTQLIDTYTPFLEKSALTYDGVHPNEAGASLLAQVVAEALRKQKMQSYRERAIR